MEKIQSPFTRLLIYAKSTELIEQICSILTYNFLGKVIRSQLMRAACSIPANIAEGYGRQSKKEFIQFVSIALGSCNEVLVYLEILNNYLGVDCRNTFKEYELLAKKIRTFRKNLYSQIGNYQYKKNTDI